MLDMIPLSPSYNGVCIDHHPLHWSESERSYKLYWGVGSTGLVVFNLFQKEIPREKLWWVAGSLVGDGSPELIPAEVWEACPFLLEEIGRPREYQGRTYLTTYPLWAALSSPVNNLCRIGRPKIALERVLSVKSPIEMIQDEAVKLAQKKVEQEIKNILETFYVRDLGRVLYLEMETDYSLTGYIASKLSNIHNKTTFVINAKNGKYSVRGVLSEYIRKLMEKYGLKAGGHPGFGAGVVPEEKRKVLLQVLSSI